MESFSREVLSEVADLRRQFDSYQGANSSKSRYYDGKYRMRDLGISLPPGLPLDSVVGWPGTVVDVLEERLEFEGWSDSSLEAAYMENDLDVKGSMAHSDALLYGTSFATVTRGGENEPDTVVNVVSPTEMVVSRDVRRGVVNRAVRFLDFGPSGPRAAVLYRPGETVWLRGDRGSWVVEDVDDHRLGRVPVAQFINRGRASKVGGRSEITPAVVGYTQSALRTLVGAEVAREFYAVPQRYMMGAPESFFLDEDGKPRGAWDAMMGKILAVERDEDGNAPSMGAFPAHSMSPFFEQIRNLSMMLSAEAAIPPSYLGFVSENPASADAIRMTENRLVKRAERRQAGFGKTWTEIARLLMMVSSQRSFSDLSPDELAVRPVWREASTPTRAAAADEVLKMTSAGVYTARGEYTYKRLGLSPQDRAMLRRDHATDMTGALERLASGAVSPEAQQLAESSTPNDE